MKKKTTEEFIKESKKVHGDKYDYSKVNYINWRTKICIICPIHGEFWQEPSNHLRGRGCPKCAKSGLRLSKDEFIEKAKKIHGDKYDYSKVNYVNNHTKVCIICPVHGEFWQLPMVHLRKGKGKCLKCSYETRNTYKRLSKDEFIEKAKQIHGDKYDYSKVEYVNTNTKVCIICHKHGEFWQTPNQHLSKHGCRKCRQSKMEVEISKLLVENKINFIPECGSSKFNWLKNYKYDFYLPDYNVAIECQGLQHFISVKQFGGNKEFEKRKKQDKEKYELSIANDIKIIYYANYKYNFPYEVILDKKVLLDKIGYNKQS